MDDQSSEAVVHSGTATGTECIDVGGDFRVPLYDYLGSFANSKNPGQLAVKLLFPNIHHMLGLIDQYHQHRCLYAQELEGDWHQSNGI